MRLLNTSTQQVQLFFDLERIPRYATVSHCWADDEVLLEDISDSSRMLVRAGYHKLIGACRAAQALDIGWLWIDTVCIDHSSSAEVGEAVNSHFRTFNNAELCIVYLFDLDHDNLAEVPDLRLLRHCQWMHRSWTVQELIAPRDARIFNNQWGLIGTKASLLPLLSDITGIEGSVLADPACISKFSVGRRMAWAAYRQTSRVEDIAYSLLGLFELSMPIIYGEGPRAFIRLQEEILKDQCDASIFGWKTEGSELFRGLFATSPKEFQHFQMGSPNAPMRIRADVFPTAGRVTIAGEFGQHGNALVLKLETESSPLNELSNMAILFQQCGSSWVRVSPQITSPVPYTTQRSLHRIQIRRHLGPESFSFIASEMKSIKSTVSSPFTTTILPQFQRGGGLKPPSIPTSPLSPYQSSGLFSLPASHVLQLNHSELLGTGTPSSPRTPQISRLDYSRFGLGLISRDEQRCTGCDSENPVPMLEGDTGNELDEDFASSQSCSEEMQLNSTLDCLDFRGLEQDSRFGFADILSSEETAHPVLAPNHPFTSIISQIAHTALKEFTVCILQASSPRRKRTRESDVYLPHKRAKTQSYPEEDFSKLNQYSDSEEDDIVLVSFVPLQTFPAFACPYYVRDPINHLECLTRADLRSIHDVKRHLWSAHRRPYFCPVCREIFPTSTICNAHINEWSCSPRSSPEVEGVSWDKVQLLARPSDPTLSVDEQWFAIWDLLIPGAKRPQHAFLSGHLDTKVRVLRDYWDQQGRRIVADFLERSELWKYRRVPDEEQALEALYLDVLKEMIDSITSNPDGTEPSASP